MGSKLDCTVCSTPLIYGTTPVSLTCAFCGKSESSAIYCPKGHFICDACHAKDALTVLRDVLQGTTSSDPIEILEKVMLHDSVAMHGPEHHCIVPAVILTAVRNAGYSIPEQAVEKAIQRGSKVPGGWCGLYGDCGAGVGVGIAVSVLTEATPLKGKQRSLAIAATSYALSRMVDDQPRCCKRASRIAVEAAIDFLRDKLDVRLVSSQPPKCLYFARNRECPKEACRFFG